MKIQLIALVLAGHIASAQITKEVAQQASVIKYHLGSYSYHEQFIGHTGYGAPLIFTSDGGAAAFGDGDEGAMVVKVDKHGREQWKNTIPVKGDEVESQSIVEDKDGNFYIFQLVHDRAKYRGGCERVVLLDRTGKILWDKLIGSFTVVDNPIISYIRALPDGRISLRGHVVREQPEKGKDPVYRYWEGWMDTTGKLTEQTGDVINWSNQDWQARYKPE